MYTHAAFMCYQNDRKYEYPSLKLDMNGRREALYRCISIN